MSETQKLKPLFLIKPKTMSRADIRRAEKLTGIVIVECEQPESARFLDAPPDAGLDVQARAALSLMRYIVANGSGATATFYKGDLTRFFIDALLTAPTPKSVAPVKR